MPTISCPSCQKRYSLPATAVGQVATCKCGKKFRVGGARPAPGPPAPKSASPAIPSKSPAAASTAAKQQVAAKTAVKTKPEGDDDFWDSALSEPVTAAKPERTQPATISSAAPADRRQRPDAEIADKKSKVRWGFDWGKVFGGLATFLIAGGIDAALVMSVGRLNIWLAIVAVGGLLTCINGLMGEEGIW